MHTLSLFLSAHQITIINTAPPPPPPPTTIAQKLCDALSLSQRSRSVSLLNSNFIPRPPTSTEQLLLLHVNRRVKRRWPTQRFFSRTLGRRSRPLKWKPTRGLSRARYRERMPSLSSFLHNSFFVLFPTHNRTLPSPTTPLFSSSSFSCGVSLQ